MKLLPLGDQAVLAYLDDEPAAFRLAAAMRDTPPPWLMDVVQAYRSVAVFFEPDAATFVAAAEWLQHVAAGPAPAAPAAGRLRTIPCCYEFGTDLERVARHTGLDPDRVVALHAATAYTVYAIGFCPGFPYLGYLPEPISGVPRLPAPRLRVPAGSVGLTGRQTGIYTEERPGGWNLIGRTPLELVHVADGYFPLRTGDRVRFTPIDAAQFRRLEGERLPD